MKSEARRVVRVDYVPQFWFFALFSLFLCGATVLMALDHFALIRSKYDPLPQPGPNGAVPVQPRWRRC
jgi:hypothetical protein